MASGQCSHHSTRAGWISTTWRSASESARRVACADDRNKGDRGEAEYELASDVAEALGFSLERNAGRGIRVLERYHGVQTLVAHNPKSVRPSVVARFEPSDAAPGIVTSCWERLGG